MSALTGLAGAIALVALVAGSDELFFGSPVARSDKASYVMFAWVVFVICAAQLVALVKNRTPWVLVSTVARTVTIVVPMFITPTLDVQVTVGVETLIQLAANLSIIAALLSRRRPMQEPRLPDNRAAWRRRRVRQRIR